MATYTVTGHPLNYTSLDVPAFAVAAIQGTGVGQTLTLTLPDDTKAKGHGALK
jgi:hypothetical protein